MSLVVYKHAQAHEGEGRGEEGKGGERRGEDKKLPPTTKNRGDEK